MTRPEAVMGGKVVVLDPYKFCTLFDKICHFFHYKVATLYAHGQFPITDEPSAKVFTVINEIKLDDF
jgi:hypothetical protein